MELTILGGGCFWCLEAAFELIDGITQVEPGYAGGDVQNPTYQEVCSGSTGHAEVVRLTFNPATINFSNVLEIFFAIHDPTTFNRQGNDVGTQYRSIILCQSDDQQITARETITRLDKLELWDQPIVTELAGQMTFYSAEPEHRQYYRNNPNQAYCQVIISPKLAKLRSKFGGRVRVEN